MRTHGFAHPSHTLAALAQHPCIPSRSTAAPLESGLRAETNEEETVDFTRQATSEKGKVGAEQGAEDRAAPLAPLASSARARNGGCRHAVLHDDHLCLALRVIRRVSLASFLRVFRRVALASFLRVFRRVALASFLRVFRRVSHHHHLSLLLVCVEHGLKRGHELETSGTAWPLMF